jgi:hypothetical protein
MLINVFCLRIRRIQSKGYSFFDFRRNFVFDALE